MFNHNDKLLELYLKIRYDEFLEEAEQYRLARQAAPYRASRSARWLVAFGRKLVQWGESLERRFDQTPPAMLHLRR